MPLAYLALSQIRAFLFRKLVLDKMALGRREAATHSRACYGSSASTILGLRKNGGTIPAVFESGKTSSGNAMPSTLLMNQRLFWHRS